MRNLLKPQSGTQSGTSIPITKSTNFDNFACGRKIAKKFYACKFFAKLVNY